MGSTPPIWDFNNEYREYGGYSHFPRYDNLSVSSDITADANRNWFQFAYDSHSQRIFNYNVNGEKTAENNQEEEMSEGIRALLEITKNVKNDSKFEGIPFTRSQDSISEGNVQRHNGSSNRSRLQQQQAFRITGLPRAIHNQQQLSAKNTNYAMAVKKTLEPKKAQNVFYHQQQKPQEQMQIREEPDSLIWVDKNGRRTVNAKEMEGGPKINGRSIVNGINLNSLKFVKPSKQCPKWDQSRHRIEEPNCKLWHPRERCQYYPKCRLTAEVCGFGHPFCGCYCKCAPEKRSLQLNHVLRKDAENVVIR